MIFVGYHAWHTVSTIGRSTSPAHSYQNVFGSVHMTIPFSWAHFHDSAPRRFPAVVRLPGWPGWHSGSSLHYFELNNSRTKRRRNKMVILRIFLSVQKLVRCVEELDTSIIRAVKLASYILFLVRLLADRPEDRDAGSQRKVHHESILRRGSFHLERTRVQELISWHILKALLKWMRGGKCSIM